MENQNIHWGGLKNYHWSNSMRSLSESHRYFLSTSPHWGESEMSRESQKSKKKKIVFKRKQKRTPQWEPLFSTLHIHTNSKKYMHTLMIYSYRKKDLLNGASCIKVVEWPSENSSVSPANTYTALQSTIATSAPLALIVQRKNPSRRFPKSWCARSFDAREVDRFFVLFFAAIWELNFYIQAGSTSGVLAASVLCVTQIIITSRPSHLWC